MTERTPSPNGRDGAEPPADEERARRYAEGFGEGIRIALKDILQHISQGYSASELRLLVQGRLARLEDEVELKRRSMLGPPRSRADLLFASEPAPRTWSPPGGSVHVVPRQSYLVNEPRPSRAVALVEAAIADFPRTILLSLHPPTLPGLPAERRVELSLTQPSAPGDAAHPIPLGQVGGRLREAMTGGALVYSDSLDFLWAEESTDTMVQFAVWLAEEARRSGSAVVVSIDAAALDLKQFARIQRAFSVQA